MMLPVAKNVRISLQPFKPFRIRTIYGYESLQPDAKGNFELPLGELNADDWRVLIAEVEATAPVHGKPAPFQLLLSYSQAQPPGREKKMLVSSSVHWGADSLKETDLNPAVVKNSVALADAMALIKVGELSREEKFSEASSILATQIVNVRAARAQRPDPELEREEKTLTDVKVIVDRRAQEKAVPVPEYAEGAKVKDVIKSAAGIASSVLPGPWAVVFAIFKALVSQ